MTKITFKQNDIEAIISILNKLSGILSGMGSTASFGSDSLFSGINKLQKNMTCIGDRASGCASVVGKGNDSFAQSEIYLESVIDKIELPTELKNVYSPTDKVEQNTVLYKEDGTSVNASDNTKLEKLNSIDGDLTKLSDITKADVKEAEFNDIYTDLSNTLGNVNKTGGDTLQKMEDVKLTQEISLGETKQGDTEEQVMNDNYSEEKKNLVTINNSVDTQGVVQIRQGTVQNKPNKTDALSYYSQSFVSRDNDDGSVTISDSNQDRFVLNVNGFNIDNVDFGLYDE